MTLKEIGYSIKNRLEGFLPSDDSSLDIEYIYSRINVARGDLIRRLSDRRMSLDDDFYQKICCLEIKCEDTTCNNIELGSQTYVDAPSTVSVSQGIKFFGTPDLRYGFQYVSNTGFVFNHASQLASHGTYYTFVNGRALLRNLPTADMAYLCMIAILDDPLNGSCVTLHADDPYPLPQIYVSEIENLVFQSLMPSMMIYPDQANDASNDARTNKLNYYVAPVRNKRPR